MKRTAPLLLLTFAVLLAGIPANAATTVSAATPEAPALVVANMSPAQAAPDCSAASLPGATPAPKPAAYNTCGTCSQTVCQGLALHTTCAYKFGHWYTCEAVLGDTCSGGGLTWDCSCWYGPLP